MDILICTFTGPPSRCYALWHSVLIHCQQAPPELLMEALHTLFSSSLHCASVEALFINYQSVWLLASGLLEGQ